MPFPPMSRLLMLASLVPPFHSFSNIFLLYETSPSPDACLVLYANIIPLLIWSLISTVNFILNVIPVDLGSEAGWCRVTPSYFKMWTQSAAQGFPLPPGENRCFPSTTLSPPETSPFSTDPDEPRDQVSTFFK